MLLFEVKTRIRTAEERVGAKNVKRGQLRWLLLTLGVWVIVGWPFWAGATHEADHRFTVEGFVCGADGKGVGDADVMVKDTKISYGQIVKTDGDGYYKASFHLHNDNLGDPLLVEAKGEQQNHKIQFDPKDLETERIIQVNFGTGCIYDRSKVPAWVWWAVGGVAALVIGAIGVTAVRSQRKQEQKRGKSQTKRKT